MAKTKRKTLVAKLDKIFSLYIRTRDCLSTTGDPEYGNCFTCGKRLHIKSAHCGHFISRRHHIIRWDDRNAHLQGPECNTFRGGAPHDYFVKMEEFYGREVVDELMSLKTQAAKFSIKELEELYQKYKQKYEEL